MTDALKHDTAKVRMELLSVPALTEIAKVLTFGANKYAAHNWRKGFEWSRLYGAALRHLTAHMSGENVDPESGLSHLAHLGCCVMFLLEHEACRLGIDDRYVVGTKVPSPKAEIDMSTVTDGKSHPDYGMPKWQPVMGDGSTPPTDGNYIGFLMNDGTMRWEKR